MKRLRLADLPSGRHTKYLVLVLWLLLAAGVAPLAMRLGEVQNNDSLSALPGSAEANRAAARVAAGSPHKNALVAVAVYARDGGLTTSDRAKIDADRAAFAGYAAEGAVPPAVPAADGRAMLLSFPLAGDNDAQSEAATKIKNRLAVDVPDGLRTALTGSAGADNDMFDAFSGMDVALLLGTGLAVALLLLITYRSPILWLIPLVVVGIADQFATALVYLLARYGGLTVDFQSQTILTVLVFGVGIDYALLLVARYREELRRHADRHEAMRQALRRSFPAILASAATVAAALLCLLAARLPATHGLGPVAAVGVGATLIAMTTLLPAVLVLGGRWLFWPFVPRYSAEAGRQDIAARHGIWGRVAAAVGRRPRAIWMGTALVLAGLILGIGKLSVGLPGDETFRIEVGSVTGGRIIQAHYPAGVTSPAEIVAAGAAADRVANAARAVPGVAEVGQPEPLSDRRWVMIRAVLNSDPGSRAAIDTVRRLRQAVHAVPGGQALVGGETAAQLDSEAAVNRDNVVVIPLILAVVLTILVLLLRALLAPLLLLVSVVVSYAAAMGAGGLVLSAWGHPRLWAPVPLQAFLFLVALGVDYTIFLMTRAREETIRYGHRTGMLHALTVTGGVITSAGIVLAATFGMLGVLPMVPSVQMGIIIGLGILLDTFLVRSLLVPALTLHVGPRTWWPGIGRRRPIVRPPTHPVEPVAIR